jgi:hypothetical protein
VSACIPTRIVAVFVAVFVAGFVVMFATQGPPETW